MKITANTQVKGIRSGNTCTDEIVLSSEDINDIILDRVSAMYGEEVTIEHIELSVVSNA